MRPWLRLFGILCCLLLVSSFATAQSNRMVVLGDQHGQLGNFVNTIHELKLTDKDGRWIAPRTRLRLMGDLVGKGPDSVPLINYVQELQLEARRVGSFVDSLAGNHEAFVGRGVFKALSAEDQLRLSLMSDDPYETLANEFGLDGSYGWWIRKMKLYDLQDGVLYIHAGVENSAENFDLPKSPPPQLGHYLELVETALSPEEVFLRNALFSKVLTVPEILSPEALDRFLGRNGLKAIAVGHTPTLTYNYEIVTEHRVFGDKVWMLDTGLANEAGRPSALIVEDGKPVDKFHFDRSAISPAYEAVKFRCDSLVRLLRP